MKTKAMPQRKLPEDDPPHHIQWFTDTACVVDHGDRREVFVGGRLLGAFTREDVTSRNVLVVMLAGDPKTHLGKLAKAFGLSSDRVLQLRRKYESKGMAALVTPSRNGRPPKVTPKKREALEALFDAGLTIAEARKKVRGLGFSTIGFVHTAWTKKREAERAKREADEAAAARNEPLPLPGFKRMAPRPMAGPPTPIAAETVHGGPFVQHAGTWIVLAMLAKLGLYEAAERAGEGRVEARTLRVALDAAAIALTLGQSCVEGVRRIATPTSPVLLRAETCPSPPSVRQAMRELADDLGAMRFHVAMLAMYLRSPAHDDHEGGVYYVDNHMRPYTGKFVTRRGWRMQDKRVRPGITDYYVHDEDGRPLFRIDVASHDSLTQWLAPIGALLRRVVGEGERVLLAFDRAGAFAESMASLRDTGFELVTYERRPFPLLGESAFTETALVGDDDEVRLTESQINLGAGRGRVRRIAVREVDGRQVNLLAVSELPAARLVAIMRGRWRQENGFKHGVERWGINQLDRRKTVPYSPDTIVPNPARRRLDRALRAACIRDGDARRLLAQLPNDHARRERVERDLREAIALQRRLQAERPSTPKHAPLRDTELAGKLVRHDGRAKTVLDTVRIACANVEADLAAALAPYLPRAAEAKKTLANLFAAPGRVRVGLRTIAVDLAPAGTALERAAFRELLAALNREKLSLPGDARRRRLRFRS
jgi:transposase